MIRRNVIADTVFAIGMETAGRAALRHLLAAAEEPRKTQEHTLRGILRSLQETEFGRIHHYNRLVSPDDFRRAVPIHDYETLRPYVDRQIATGLPILTDERAIMYARTSGTTGKPKLFPVTSKVVNGLKDAQRAMAYVQHKAYGSFGGRLLAIGGPLREETLVDGTPAGSTTGLIYETMPRLIRSKYVLPAEVFVIEDYELRYAVIARLGVQFPDVTAIATANPSTILRLLHQIEADLPILVEELAQGGSRLISRLPAEIASSIATVFNANAAQSLALKSRLRSGPLLIGDVWPNLRSVMTWLSGGCAVAAEAVRRLLPPTARMIDAGYVASEVRGTIVVDAERNLALPLLRDVFFEFAPVADWTAGKRETRLLHEIADGQDYYVFVTTLGGLARYHMNDIMRVSGRIGRTPTLAFVRKGRGVTNITGEKLSEDQVNSAMSNFVNEACLQVPFYVFVADPALAGYLGYIEAGNVLPERFAEFAARLDQSLRALNIEYDSKRASGRLQPLRLARLSEGAERGYRRHCIGKGQRESQLKVLTLQDAGEFDFDLSPFLLDGPSDAPAPR